MSEKGFTLVEMLAIIIVLLCICAISYPTLTNYFKNNKTTEMEAYKKNLCIAAKTYINDNKDEYPNMSTVGTITEVNISDLIYNGYVDTDLTEPNSDESASLHKLIVTVESDKTLSCVYQ